MIHTRYGGSGLGLFICRSRSLFSFVELTWQRSPNCSVEGSKSNPTLAKAQSSASSSRLHRSPRNRHSPSMSKRPLWLRRRRLAPMAPMALCSSRQIPPASRYPPSCPSRRQSQNQWPILETFIFSLWKVCSDHRTDR
jgi:hypothetical protein